MGRGARGGRGRRPWARLVVVVVAAALAVGGCGGDDDDADADQVPAQDEADPAGGAGGDETGEASEGAGGLPDPCTMVAPDQLAGLLGTDPGAGSLQAPVPAERKVCMFGNGTILAVEVADHWDISLDIIRDEFGADALQEVPGVGEAAYWQATGGQFLALGDGAFVGVTGAADQATAQSVAEAMLAAL